jgi:hypothetical protein
VKIYPFSIRRNTLLRLSLLTELKAALLTNEESAKNSSNTVKTQNQGAIMRAFYRFVSALVRVINAGTRLVIATTFLFVAVAALIHLFR